MSSGEKIDCKTSHGNPKKGTKRDHGEKPGWFFKPKTGENTKKLVDGRQWWFCPHHGDWTCHPMTKCLKAQSSNKGDDKDKKKSTYTPVQCNIDNDLAAAATSQWQSHHAHDMCPCCNHTESN